jgi:hypothetical protein
MKDNQHLSSGRGGKREGAGRKPGVPNKLTGQVKEMSLEALHDAGGVNYLSEQADQNPSAFMTLLGKVLPLQVTGDPNNPLQIIDRVERVIVDVVAPTAAPTRCLREET